MCGRHVCSRVGCATSERTTKTKIEIKDGKDVTVPVASRRERRERSTCSRTSPTNRRLHSYVLCRTTPICRNTAVIGLRSKVRPRNRGDGKIKTETKTTLKIDNGTDKETKAKSEVKGDLAGLPYLGVKSLKMVAASCP